MSCSQYCKKALGYGLIGDVFSFKVVGGIMANLKITGVLNLMTHSTLILFVHFPKEFHLHENSVDQHLLRSLGLT